MDDWTIQNISYKGRTVIMPIRDVGVGLLSLMLVAGFCEASTGGPKAVGIDGAKVARIQRVMDDAVDLVNRVSDRLGQVADKDTALSAAKDVKKSAARVRELAKGLKAERKLTREENAELVTKRMRPAQAKFSRALKAADTVLKGVKVPPESERALRAAVREFGLANVELSQAFAAIGP